MPFSLGRITTNWSSYASDTGRAYQGARRQEEGIVTSRLHAGNISTMQPRVGTVPGTVRRGNSANSANELLVTDSIQVSHPAEAPAPPVPAPPGAGFVSGSRKCCFTDAHTCLGNAQGSCGRRGSSSKSTRGLMMSLWGERNLAIRDGMPCVDSPIDLWIFRTDSASAREQSPESGSASTPSECNSHGYSCSCSRSYFSKGYFCQKQAAN
ncbi:hypothetical protein V1509DRAFT_627893, partial [Lipomyces kononenkoae]